MEEKKERSIHQTTLMLFEDLQHSSSYVNFYKEIQKLSTNPEVSSAEFKESLMQIMRDYGLETELRNQIYHWIKNKKRDLPHQEQNFLQKAQMQWDKRVQKSLNSMCSELNVHLAKYRSPADKDDMEDKWNELSTYEVDISLFKPVYAPKDFLEVLLSIRCPMKKKTAKTPQWEFSYLPLQRALYTDLARGESILGVVSANACQSYYVLEEERISLGQKVLEANHAPVAQEYLKRGCPHCLRAKIWSLVLGSGIHQNHFESFERLKSHVLMVDLMTDKLIIKDINLTASNDDQYFVFEDVLYQVMLCFSRDPEVFAALPSGLHMQAVMKGRPSTSEHTLIFPPNGVIPYHGISMYAVPFCYLYDEPVALYFTFRAFYLRYFFRLHRVCGHIQGIISLCLLYERLLQVHEPLLWYHFKNCGIQPIRVVFKWLMRAFSGYLPPEQLLFLWDLVLAYDSLEVIPLLAVSILCFRRDNLLQVTTLQSMETVLADLSSICVMNLLQMALLKE